MFPLIGAKNNFLTDGLFSRAKDYSEKYSFLVYKDDYHHDSCLIYNSSCIKRFRRN